MEPHEKIKTLLFSSDVRLHLSFRRRGVPYENIKCCMFVHGPATTTWDR